MLQPEHGQELFTNAAPGIVGIHDTVLQLLDSYRPYQNDDGSVESVFFGVDNFRGTETAWGTVPIILGKRHPKTPYQQNPVKALEESEGVVSGNMEDVIITSSGTPLLRGKTVFTNSEAESKHKERKLALSTGFISGRKDGKLTGTVIPDHILIFEHDRTHRPQDAAMWLNGVEEKMSEDTANISGVLKEFLAELKSLIVPGKPAAIMPELPESTGMVSNMTEIKIAELEKQIADSNELIKNMTETIDGYKKADETRAAAELETKWTLVKNSIAPGITATAETEAAARKEWELDATEFLIKNAIAKKPETAAEGVQFVTNSTPDESDKAYLELVSMTGGFRRR